MSYSLNLDNNGHILLDDEMPSTLKDKISLYNKLGEIDTCEDNLDNLLVIDKFDFISNYKLEDCEDIVVTEDELRQIDEMFN